MQCRVYWGSHGCHKKQGHGGKHACTCCPCFIHIIEHKLRGCVAKYPYYGRKTNFYGEDAPSPQEEKE